VLVLEQMEAAARRMPAGGRGMLLAPLGVGSEGKGIAVVQQPLRSVHGDFVLREDGIGNQGRGSGCGCLGGSTRYRIVSTMWLLRWSAAMILVGTCDDHTTGSREYRVPLTSSSQLNGSYFRQLLRLFLGY